jgi:serine/threonine protein phosphatase PrpC
VNTGDWESIHRVHEQLLKEAGGRVSPGTTLTLVLLVWPRAYLVHVGDSRAYVRRRGRVQPLTRDQTFGEYMVSGCVERGAGHEEQDGETLPAIGAVNSAPNIGLIDSSRATA